MTRRLTISIIFVIVAFTANCQVANGNHSHFTFPFSEIDGNWNEFKTPQDRIAALQIPDNILDSIQSEELLLICLDFPYLSDVYAYDDIEKGVRAVAAKFNGFREFLIRQDHTETLEKVFQQISKNHLFLGCNSDLEIGRNSMRISLLSYLLGRYEIQDNLTSAQKKNLSELTQNNIDAISQYSSFAQSLGYNSLHSLKRILSDSPQREIYGDYYSVTRYTPNGSPVLAWKLYQNELSQYDKNYFAYEAVHNWGATIVGEATRTYNCHAYAWHLSENGDSVWIGANSLTDENIYWEDSSYIEVPESYATKVSYYESMNANHSAVRINSNLYRSKWGSWPLVEHAPNACPYDTTMPKKYYIRCPSIQGNSSPCGTEIYSIDNLPNNAIVYWSFLEGSIYYNSLLQSNQPLIGQCTINIDNNENINDTLVAQIYVNGGLMCTLKKSIKTGWAFTGTYNINNLYNPTNVNENPIYNHKRILVSPNHSINITSDHFPNVTLSHTTSSQILWNYDGNTHVTLSVSPFADDGHRMTITGVSNTGNNCDDFKFFVDVIVRIPQLKVSLQDNNLNLSLENDSTNSFESKMDRNLWHVYINNVSTGQTVFFKSTDEEKISINTSSWIPGLYAIRYVCNGETASQKLFIK